MTRIRCQCCGDLAERLMGDRSLCRDCYDELSHGIVRNQNVNFFPRDDIRFDELDQWQENAIRIMEDVET
jgi:hypothetical protein